jgi:hypothetical protein
MASGEAFLGIRFLGSGACLARESAGGARFWISDTLLSSS